MTCNKNNKFISDKKISLLGQISELYTPEVIAPKFFLPEDGITNSNLLSIRNANIGYSKDKIILKNITIGLSGKERIAICGKNASGKSTLLKAILGKKEIFKTEEWYLPNPKYIGYLDQHYSHLCAELSAIDHIRSLRPDWDECNIRKHLNDFLFRKNQEVELPAASLSGGEQVRLSLSIIAAKTPKLLVLDEITNNIDLETKEHVVQVLKKYPGAMIVVSHEEDFLKSIKIDRFFNL